jgi:hypothetical protein
MNNIKKHTNNNEKALSFATNCTTRRTAQEVNKAQEGKESVVLTTIDSLKCYMNIKETSTEASTKLLDSVKATSLDETAYTYRETDQVYKTLAKREQAAAVENMTENRKVNKNNESTKTSGTMKKVTYADIVKKIN